MIKILSGDRYRVRLRLQALKNDFLADNDPLSLEEIDIEARPELSLGDLLGILTGVSLFNPRKMVILKNLSTRSDLQEQIEVICSKITEDVTLVIVELKLDNKTHLGKFLKKQPGCEVYMPYRGGELEEWLIAQAQEGDCHLSRQSAAHLIERAGTELLLLEKEIAKLRVHPSINRELIDDLVAANPHSQTFDFLDALMRGQLVRALAFYQEQRQQKTDPLVMIGLLVWQLRVLVLVSEGRFSDSELQSEFGLKPFVLQKARALTRNIGSRQLFALIRLACRTDRRIRSEFVKPDEALLFLVFKACRLTAA